MGFATHGAELRCFAAKILQTVEKTVKKFSAPPLRAREIVHGHGSYLCITVCGRYYAEGPENFQGTVLGLDVGLC